MIENKHDVAKSQWRKWSRAQRAMFNSLYEDIMQMGVSLFVHPETVERKISDAEFSTIAWNAAFLAACHTDNAGRTTEVVDRDREGMRQGAQMVREAAQPRPQAQMAPRQAAGGMR